MSRRKGKTKPEWDKHLAGVAATFEATCLRCDRAIVTGTRVVNQHGHWIHIECAPGWED